MNEQKDFKKYQSYIKNTVCGKCRSALEAEGFFDQKPKWGAWPYIMPPRLDQYGRETHLFHGRKFTFRGYAYRRDGNMIAVTQENVDPVCLPTLFSYSDYPKRKLLTFADDETLEHFPKNKFCKCVILLDLKDEFQDPGYPFEFWV